MNKIEAGKKFTDSIYASKEEVSQTYNQGDINDIWDNVLFYRSFYDEETEMIDKNHNHYKVCLTKNLLSESYNLQLRIIERLSSFSALQSDLSASFSLEQLKKSLSQTSQFQSINASENVIDKIARNELENATPKYFPLKAYEQAYRYALSINKIDLESIETLNKILTGEDKEAMAHYRSGNMMDVINPLVLPPFEEIKIHFDAFFSFLSQEEIPLLIRALSIVYFFTYLRPFELFNEETAGLVAKAFLKCNHLSYFGFVLPLESLAYTTSASYFKKLKMAEETLDLTYFLQSTIRFLHYGFDLVDKDFSEFLEKGKERSITSPNTDEKNIVLKDDAAVFALPDFPSMQNETEIEVLSRKLMSVYPQLKKKQAHFYAGHCQVGLNYTIEQFKKEEKTVYETARTSMEDLANRGFYRKLQIGKKFVYTPIPLKEIND